MEHCGFSGASSFGTADGVVSFPELVAVFAVEFEASPELRQWVASATGGVLAPRPCACPPTRAVLPGTAQ